MALPRFFKARVLLLSGCVMPLRVANHDFWEGGPCPQAERGCESCHCLGVAGGEGQGPGMGTVPAPARGNHLPPAQCANLALFVTFIFVARRLGVAGKVEYLQL